MHARRILQIGETKLHGGNQRQGHLPSRGRWISVVCLALTCDELSSLMQASFSKVDVVLDATKDFVIDRFLVA